MRTVLGPGILITITIFCSSTLSAQTITPDGHATLPNATNVAPPAATMTATDTTPASAAPAASPGAGPVAAPPAAAPAKAKGPSGPSAVAKLPHDIADLVPYQPGVRDYLLPALAVLVLSGLVAGLLRWLIKRQRRALANPKTTPVDPWLALAQHLAGLQVRPDWAAKEREEYFYALSMGLRQAIELSIGARATDMTLHELKAPLREQLPLPAATTAEMLALLERCDLVKFAGMPAASVEAEAAKSKVLAWIGSLQDASKAQAARAAAAEAARARQDKYAEHQISSGYLQTGPEASGNTDYHPSQKVLRSSHEVPAAPQVKGSDDAP